MNSHMIRAILENLIDPARVEFAGVFPRDKVPDHRSRAEKYPYCFVANTDTAGQSGEHWVAFFYPNADECEFFDSYGLHPQFDYHFPLSLLPTDQIHIATDTLQSSTSNVCGHFVIYFLAKRSLNHSFQTINDSFQKGSPEWNEHLVHEFVRRRFRIRSYLPYIIHFHRSVSDYYQTCCARSRLQSFA